VRGAELDELERDGRAGARSLAQTLRERRRRYGAESRRIARLFALERELWDAGCARVAGIDEVGMGPLAGPVVAAAVVLPGPLRLEGLDDSKRLREPDRDRLAAEIREAALGVGIGMASREEIDEHNIYRAGLLAMRRALDGLREAPAHVLVDGRSIPDLDTPQRSVPRGDARVASIAAASIVAKVHRDRLMTELDWRYPGYGFARHKGYGTAAHLSALANRGPTPEHRRSFAPVAAALGTAPCPTL
jgi:ribonuclease HII